MTSSEQDGEPIKESKTISTIHRLYRDDEDLVFRDPNKRRSFINRSAYAKLHRSSSTGTNRHSVGNLKGRFESLARQNSDDPPPKPEAFTPEDFGYPKTAKLVPPLIKPKPQLRKRLPKDVNSNDVNQKSEPSNAEEYRTVVVQASASNESVDRIAKELSDFTMDGKPKERKRGSFRKLFLGNLFAKDKKKKEEERNRSIVYTDNLKNETSFVRQTVPVKGYNEEKEIPANIRNQEIHEEKIKELEEKYAELHVNRFNQIRQSFSEKKSDYVPMENTKKKPTISDYISSSSVKYIDTSSSGSIETEKPNGVVPRDTPPRAQETYQNIRVVKPKSTQSSPRTIERNLSSSNSKDYPDKSNITPDDTYGTVFDSLESSMTRNGDIKRQSVASLKSPLSLESSKLKLPPNREIYEPQPRLKSPPPFQPRVKSPIPVNQVSTEKIIATELLKNTRSPTPPKRTVSNEVVITKPPMSPKSPRKSEVQADKIITNAVVHAPRRAETPDLSFRVSTPVDLRKSVTMKMSPQKPDIRKSVEAYYWKELKKMKEEEDSRLYEMQMNGYFDDQAKLRRSRSLSPSQRAGRRSLSLPRNGGTVYDTRMQPQQAIPEDHAIMVDGPQRQLVFARGNPERRTVDSLRRPIFRRGSLTKQEIYETQGYNKRVSFSNGQQVPWPTRNGYVQSPPQRRIDSELEDEVFVSETRPSKEQIYSSRYTTEPSKEQLYATRYVQNEPKEPVYGTRYVQNEPVYGTRYQNEPLYSNRVLEQFRAQQEPLYDTRRQVYGQVPQMGSRRPSLDSLQYVSRRPVSNYPEEYGRILRQHPSNSQLSLQRNSVYSSRQSMAEPIYGQKQITVRNKYCDIYGQIHDSPKTGVVMGQLSTPPVPPHQPDNFIRGSRLTSSANDIGQRFLYDPRRTTQNFSPNYDNRPLPPPPSKTTRPGQSDTESGSDASEIQRILQSKTKSKKRGLFGK